MGPREIRNVHQLLRSPLWSLQLPTTVPAQLVDAKWACRSSAALSVVSAHIQAVQHKVSHTGRQSRSVSYRAERRSSSERRGRRLPRGRQPGGPGPTTHSSASQHVKGHASCLDSSEVKQGEGLVQVTVQVWALKQDVWGFF